MLNYNCNQLAKEIFQHDVKEFKNSFHAITHTHTHTHTLHEHTHRET